jgi:hypothetical protein
MAALTMSHGVRRALGRWNLWLFIALVALAVLFLTGTVDTDAAGIAVAVLALALVVLVVDGAQVRAWLDRTESVKAFGVEVALTSAREVANALDREAESDDPDAGAGRPSAVPTIDDWLELQFKIERKLVFVGQRWLPGEAATIPGLRERDLLDDDQARTAYQLQRWTPAELSTLPPEAAQEFGAAAGLLARNFRAVVFNGVVRQELKRHGFGVSRLRQTGRLPYYRATREGNEFLVASTFASRWDSRVLSRAVERLVRRTRPPSVRIIVVPDDMPAGTRTTVAEGKTPGPRVVRLKELGAVLTELATADESAS